MARRSKYVKDYVTREEEGSRKETVIYTGKYYRMDVSNEKRRRIGFSYLGLQSVFTIAFAVMGFLNTESSRQLYVVLPYMFLFLPIYYGLLGIIKLIGTKEKMTFKEYDQSVLRIKKSTTGMMVLSLATAIGEVFYLFQKGISSIGSLEYKFLAGALFLAAGSFLFLQLQSKHTCIEEEQEKKVETHMEK